VINSLARLYLPNNIFQEAAAAAMEAAAAAEAAEAAVYSLGLDSVGVDVHATDGDDEMALAAAGEYENY